MILALSTLMATVGTININADDTIGNSSQEDIPSIIDVINLKNYILSGEQYASKYDYNQDGDVDYTDLMSLKKEIFNEPNSSDTQVMTEVTEVDTLNQDMKANILDFSIDFLKRQVEEDENAILSPQSLYFALGMTVNGAKGITQKELKDVLYKDVSTEEFNNNISYLINQTDTDVCKIANSIWVRESDDFGLNEDFQNYSEKYFKSEIYQQPFDSILVSDVNNWVDEHTDGMIDEVLDDVPSEQTIMYLINAICFEGKWEQEYDEYSINENGIFTNSKGEQQEVAMLYSQEDVYLSDDNAQGFLKYYDGGKYAFMGILPNSDISVEEYLSNLDGESFAYLYNNQVTENMELNVSIPEFTIKSDYLLNDTLQDMGINSAFNYSADFSGMLTKNIEMYISKVIQKAYIQVDRNGTKAAAVTVVENECNCVPEGIQYYNVYLNRPFIYAIVDTDTELPVFMGVVNSIDSQDTE